MSQYIANFDECSPRSKEAKVVEYISGELKAKNLDPARIYAMADSNN